MTDNVPRAPSLLSSSGLIEREHSRRGLGRPQDWARHRRGSHDHAEASSPGSRLGVGRLVGPIRPPTRSHMTPLGVRGHACMKGALECGVDLSPERSSHAGVGSENVLEGLPYATPALRAVLEHFCSTLSERDHHDLVAHLASLARGYTAELNRHAPGAARARTVHRLVDEGVAAMRGAAATCSSVTARPSTC
jgi:hypothetical protein